MRVQDPVSGRMLEIFTDQPGIQVYTGNKLTGAFAGHDNVIYRQSAGLALEPQDFPDAPHHANFLPASFARMKPIDGPFDIVSRQHSRNSMDQSERSITTCFSVKHRFAGISVAPFQSSNLKLMKLLD